MSLVIIAPHTQASYLKVNMVLQVINKEDKGNIKSKNNKYMLYFTILSYYFYYLVIVIISKSKIRFSQLYTQLYWRVHSYCPHSHNIKEN